jgi:hypothetical protein
MAVSSLSPFVPTADQISLGEASTLFAQTGHPASVQNLRRWCRKHGTPLSRRGRADYASWSDQLEVHAAEVDRRARG